LDIAPPPGHAKKAWAESKAEELGVPVERLAATLRGQSMSPFISPRPVEVSDERQEGEMKEIPANPFAAAAMANGSRKKKGPGGIFRKLTEARNKNKEVKVVKPAEAPVLTPAPAPAAESNPPNIQPRLGGMDPVDRMPMSQSDDDLLEIPTFLRRQAN
jgi:cell division protein FtsZ